MSKTLTSADSPLRIDSVALPGGRGQIGMTFCPGKKDRGYSGTTWNRDLDSDLDEIKAWGADAIVTLLEEFELKMLGIPNISDQVLKREIEWYHLPIRDLDIPDPQFDERWLDSWQQLKSILFRGGKILLHCRGGIGRTGTIVAKLLVEFGFKPSHAIDLVRKVRPGTIETEAQEQYVLRLKRWPSSSSYSAK